MKYQVRHTIHYLPQLSSSLPSAQSAALSQSQELGMHLLPSRHMVWSLLQVPVAFGEVSLLVVVDAVDVVLEVVVVEGEMVEVLVVVLCCTGVVLFSGSHPSSSELSLQSSTPSQRYLSGMQLENM